MGKLQNSHMIEVDEYIGSVIDEKTTEEILNSVDLLYGNYWVGYVAEQLIDYKKEV